MVSFQYLFENISNIKTKDDENKKIAAIKLGLATRPSTQEGYTFWDDFMKVCGDAEALSHLLGVNKFTVSSWNSKIKKYLKIVQEETSEVKDKKKNNMLNTGNE
jgi:hypothetical protein